MAIDMNKKPRIKRTVFLSIEEDGCIICHDSKKDAKSYQDSGISEADVIACIKVELDFEEGEGL